MRWEYIRGALHIKEVALKESILLPKEQVKIT
jgi:hypothetical protein